MNALLSVRPRLFAGIRPGVSFGPEDFRSARRATSAAAAREPGFIYVVTGDHGACKIGITANVNARLAQLQTASAVPLRLAGAPRDEIVGIEADVHAMLDKYRQNGEWFSVPVDGAVAAIHAAAFQHGQPVLDLDAAKAEQIRQIIAQQPNKPSTVWSRVGEGILQLLFRAAIAVAMLVAAFLALVRFI